MKTREIKTILVFGLLTLLLIAGTAAVYGQEEDPASGNEFTCREPYGYTEIPVNGPTYTLDLDALGVDADKGLIEVCYKASTDEFFFGPFDPLKRVYEFATSNGHDISHIGYKLADNEEATASVSVGACAWSPAGGSTRDVDLTISGASVTITEAGGASYGPFTSTQSIILPVGSYSYTWTALTGYTGSGSGSFDVEDCPPATATVTIGGCTFDDQELVSSTQVTLTLSNAILTIKDSSNAEVGVYSTTKTISLPAGSYTYSWIAKPGYSGMGSSSFTLLTCEPGKADASVDVGACTWDAQNGSQINVSITIDNATLTINGHDYSSTQTIKLAPGTYDYSWVATGDYEGSGEGSITIYGCEPASASVEVGSCSWVDLESKTDVSINVNGATLKIYQGASLVATFGPGAHTLDLPEGSYTYEWTANENYTGSGSGSFSAVNCEPGKSDAAVELGSCVYDEGQSLTPVTITISNAKLTINGKEYTENATLKLAPGDYPYSWVSISDDYVGSGEGVVTVGACTPKEYDDPDRAAGGLGPTLIGTAAPALMTVSGLGLAWVFIKNRKEQNS
jgi:hypothetical protein